MVNVLAIPVVVGLKTARERFAGATATYTLEGMMGDGKALQLGTSHELGQNFAKAFDINYSSAEGGREHAWTTSWGTSTRMLGGLIMCHGDDNGLRVPPRLAPIQAYVMVVKAGDGVAEAAPSCATRCATPVSGSRSTTGSTPRSAAGPSTPSCKGYPVRVEVGPRDLAAGNAVAGPADRRLEDAHPGRRTWSARSWPPWRPTSRRCYDEALARRRVPHRRGVDRSPRRSRRRPPAGPGCPGRRSASQGEAEANGQGVTVRCLLRADGSVPDIEDEPDLVAILARAVLTRRAVRDRLRSGPGPAGAATHVGRLPDGQA